MINYKSTVFLPKTSFAIRVNLPQKEQEIISKWQKEKIYQKLREHAKQQNRKKFILHDGPPYANGHIHMGHALNKIIKDIVVRSQQMMGKDAPFIPGWDCHGLPIEWKVEEQYKKNGKNKDLAPIAEFRQECKKFASHWIKVQAEEFKRLGIIGDWKNPYITMNNNIEAQIVRELGKFLLNNGLYRGVKPVLWSVVEKTALAEAEVEYKERVSPSIYIRFSVTSSPHTELLGASALVWTTTPWTIPGNRAVAYNKDIIYSLVQVSSCNANNSSIKLEEKFLLAKDLVEQIAQEFNVKFNVIKTFKGSDLNNTICKHPFYASGYDFNVPFLHGDHVQTDTGTGIVHTAPEHGLEDFKVAQQCNLEIPQTVGPDGLYYEHVPIFKGQHIFKANDNVIHLLIKSGSLVHQNKITHSYPHSWRSKAPLIYRTTTQLFISMEKNDLSKIALQSINDIKWFPQQSKKRMISMIESRPDWCISRQRSWGVPITVFVSKKTGELLRDKKIHDRIADAIEKHGSDIWFQDNPTKFLSPEYDPEDYEASNDILDIWFEAGCSHSYVLENNKELNWPASLYLEGSDQHRGWFQLSLLESCGTRKKAPYKSVLTHGFMLDDKGHKMSKSLGNILSPQKCIDKFGADILRLLVVNSDYSEDIKIGMDSFQYQQDIYRRLRNTLRYLLGSLTDFSEEEIVNYDALPELEKWVLHRLYELSILVKKNCDNFDFQTMYYNIHNFCATELSSFYFDIRKDVLYCDAKTNLIRQSTRTIFNILFNTIIKWLAPALCFTAEEAWLTRYPNAQSIHLESFPEVPDSWLNHDLGNKYSLIRKLRQSITSALEIARSNHLIGSSLQAHPIVYDPQDCMSKNVNWAELAITSDYTIKKQEIPKVENIYHDEVNNIGILIHKAEGKKCERCWKILPEVDSLYLPNLCQRCFDVVTNIGCTSCAGCKSPCEVN